MTAFLLDTDAVSLSAPGKPPLPAPVREWFEAHSDALYLSAVTVAEIERSIRRLRRQDAIRKASMLARWFDTILDAYRDRVLSFDLEAGRIAGQIDERATASGQPRGFPDVAIAATALRHNLLVVTRNLRHFEALGVTCIDPLTL